jgi:hypothetical protein
LNIVWATWLPIRQKEHIHFISHANGRNFLLEQDERMTIGESNLKVFSQMEENNFISVYNSIIMETKYYMKLFGAPAPLYFVYMVEFETCD